MLAKNHCFHRFGTAERTQVEIQIKMTVWGMVGERGHTRNESRAGEMEFDSIEGVFELPDTFR